MHASLVSERLSAGHPAGKRSRRRCGLSYICSVEHPERCRGESAERAVFACCVLAEPVRADYFAFFGIVRASSCALGVYVHASWMFSALYMYIYV